MTRLCLARLTLSRYLPSMARKLNLGDRARLRERFFGAMHTVLASLDLSFRAA